MSTTGRFRTQHADLLRMVKDLRTDLESPTMDAKALRSALSVIAGKISLHLAMEDDSLYPRMRSHPNPDLGSLAMRFSEEMQGIKSAFQAYSDRWNSQRIEVDRAGFSKDTNAIFLALENRIHRENNELYALYDKAGQ